MGSITLWKFEGPIVFTDGAVGIEGSILTVSLLLSIGIFLYYKAYKEEKIIKRKNLKS